MTDIKSSMREAISCLDLDDRAACSIELVDALNAYAQMVEKVREVIADIEGSRGDEEDLYWFGRWSDQLRHAIGDGHDHA